MSVKTDPISMIRELQRRLDRMEGDIEIAGAVHVHVQDVPADVWVIHHNLQRYPWPSAVDSSNVVIGGNVQYVDENTLTITFLAEFSGKAYVS